MGAIDVSLAQVNLASLKQVRSKAAQHAFQRAVSENVGDMFGTEDSGAEDLPKALPFAESTSLRSRCRVGHATAAHLSVLVL